MSVNAVRELAWPLRPVAPVVRDPLAEGADEGNPAVFFADIDEAVHGMYALAKNGETGTLHDYAGQQMQLALNHHTAAALAFEPVGTTAAGVGGMVSTSVFVVPAAGLAVHAGLHEWREGAEHARLFAERGCALQKEAQLSQALSGATRARLAPVVAQFDSDAAARLMLNRNSTRAALRNSLIGKYACLSGAAILARLTVELIRTIGAAAMTGGAAPSPQTKANYLLGTGLTSNALAALASGFAVALGWHFVHKTGTFAEKWQRDLPAIMTRRGQLANLHSPYGRFLAAKVADRQRFAQSFHVKNRFFVAGAALYAAGTILPTCIKLLAAAGVLSSKKVGSQIILALFATAITGAIVMAIFSHQFLYGHPKLGRYETYALKTSPELDRRFLIALDGFAFAKADGRLHDKTYAQTKGLRLREAIFTALQCDDAQRVRLLNAAARASGRRYPKIARVGEPAYDRNQVLAQKIGQRFGNRRLRLTDVQQWLAKDSSRAHVLTYFRARFARKRELIERHLQLQERMFTQIIKEARSAADQHSRTILAGSLCGPIEPTRTRCARVQALSQRLAASDSTRGYAEVMNAVLAYETDATAGVAKSVEAKQLGSLDERLATLLLRELPARYAHDRGNLLEIEAQIGSQSAADTHPKTAVRSRAMRIVR